ncbi:MAG: 3-isopropylmalate dehydratase large subunit, partial [Candidatus Rokubacteria bacterium]|nr:3-isopropylmalate dehydratase large subunit [Candidatus Rokubacteria bacterium]
MTITEKIIAAHAGRAAVEPGEFVTVRVDLAMGNDLSTAGAIGVLRQMEARRVFDPDKVVIVFDHVVPAKDIAAATMLTTVRAWVREQGLPHVYDEGRQGIAHVVLPEQGLVLPGDLVIGGDSHTC